MVNVFGVERKKIGKWLIEMGGTDLGHWVQLPPPKTYKEKYLKLREYIYAQRDLLKDSKEYRRANEILDNQCGLIDTMEKKWFRLKPVYMINGFLYHRAHTLMQPC